MKDFDDTLNWSPIFLVTEETREGGSQESGLLALRVHVAA